jgi:hypothetical protein
MRHTDKPTHKHTNKWELARVGWCKIQKIASNIRRQNERLEENENEKRI